MDFINRDGTLKCAVKKNPAGRSYVDVCGRGCIKFSFKPWSKCKHSKNIK